MGPFQILFIVVNLAIPGYFLTRSSKTHATTEWSTWEKNMARLIDSDGGFPGCATLDVVGTIEDLCETSKLKSKEGHAVIAERASPQVVFSCEYSRQSIRVSWRLEASADADLKCRDPGGAMAPHAPGFSFAHSGRVRSYDFLDAQGAREMIPVRNCRAKAVRAKALAPPTDLDRFFAILGRMSGDPSDYIDANFVCFVFDASPLWDAWRDRYPR